MAEQETGAPGAMDALDLAAGGPRRTQPGEIPREAKISFAIGIALLVALLIWPIVMMVLSRMTADAPATTTTAPAPSAPSAPARPGDAVLPGKRSGSSANLGGGAPTGTLTENNSNDPEPPMARPCYMLLRSFKAFLYEASHLPKGQEPGSLDLSAIFPAGSLDGASAETLSNLELAQFRVARMPVQAIRILHEGHYTGGAKSYEFEVVSIGNAGEELSAYGTIAIDPTSSAPRIVNLTELEPFDNSGGAHTTAFEAEQQKDAPNLLLPGVNTGGPAAADTGKSKALYPFVIQ